MSILGDDTAGGGSIGGATDRALVTLFTAPDTGADGTMYARFTAGSTAGSSVKGLIFANNSGTPGTLLASTAAAAVPAGGGLITLGTVTISLTASTTYFLGIVWNSFEASLVMDDGLSGMDTEMMNGTYVSYTTPGNWGTTDISYTTNRVNAWLDYAASGGGSPFSYSSAAVLTGVGAAAIRSPVSVVASAVLSASGRSSIASPVSVVSAGSLTAIGSAAASSVASIASAAIASFVGSSTTTANAAASISAIAALSVVGASTNATVINATSAAVLFATGAGLASSAWSGAAVAQLTAVGQAVHSAVWGADSVAALSAVGTSVAAGSGAFNVASTSLLQAVGAALSSAALATTASAILNPVSGAIAAEAPTETSRPPGQGGGFGWNAKKRTMSKRRKTADDNSLIMTLCQKELPMALWRYYENIGTYAQ